ncbi:ranBP2-type zinc finger protein At1g67325 [Primulina eburnea]|uniref:ranBP2-type zinc finger protein At1g67325 n=1 Tax=Primulina eburnea TaxID=1245227 RepID=UPI003C6C89A7
MGSEAGGGSGGGGGGGRDRDWECNGCRNRNYAFRSFCNRCKQPRLLVDTKTPSDSKWLPRIGDWICTGCTNNNYASRVNCKKCGQPKEVAAMPAIAMPGASVHTHPNYFARVQRGVEQMLGVGSLQQSLSSGWPLGGTDEYGIHSTDPYSLQPTWSLGGNGMPMVPFSSQPDNMNPVPNGWRAGDWLCPCGYHNYSSRAQCKKCNAPTPTETPSSLMNAAVTAVGTKRVASEEFAHNWDSKRLNAGRAYGMQQSSSALEPFQVSGYPTISSGTSAMASNLQVNFQMLPVSAAPLLLGKGAKQWRNGDWMCSNCNNHNYASRAQCNRCKTERDDAIAEAVSVA